MRSFALGSFALTLGLAACNRDSSVSSMTGTTGEDPGTTQVGVTTTADPVTTTTASPTTDPVSTTTTTSGTTVDPTTGGTTADIGATTLVGTTGEPPVFPPGGDWGRCSNENGAELTCDGDAKCLDEHNVGPFDGSYCSPRCADGPCPEPPDMPASIQTSCAFDSDGDSKGDLCALLCDLDMDECPGDMACDDVGIPKMKDKSIGVCTWLKG